MELCKPVKGIGDSKLEIVLIKVKLFELGKTSDGFRNLAREEVTTKICFNEIVKKERRRKDVVSL